MLIKYTCFEDSFFNIMDNSSENVVGFQFDSERDFLQESFFNEDDENEIEQERSSSIVSQAVEEWCKCGKCEPMPTEKECRCCPHKAASHYLNSNIRGGSRNCASSKLKIFVTYDSQLADAGHCHKGLHVRC